MKQLASLTLFAMLLFGTETLANAQCPSGCLFYGGDFDPNNPNANGLANENDAIVHGKPYGAAAYQNFIIPSGQTWNISGLFSNDIMFLSPPNAYWEIRSGVSEGNGGTLLASGTGSDSYHLKGQFEEYTNTVSGLNLTLDSGMYWLTVLPDAPDQQGRSFNTNTFGLNAVGTQVSDRQFFNSPFFSFTFTNADNLGVFPTLSSGVLGTEVPEPCSILMLASGLLGVARVFRRRCSE